MFEKDQNNSIYILLSISEIEVEPEEGTDDQNLPGQVHINDPSKFQQLHLPFQNEAKPSFRSDVLSLYPCQQRLEVK